MDVKDWDSLALRYVQRKLTEEEKMLVYNLLSESAEFRTILKEELDLSRRMAALRVSLSEESRLTILQKVQHTAVEGTEQNKSRSVYLMDLILSMTMPNLALDMINLLKRSCV